MSPLALSMLLHFRRSAEPYRDEGVPAQRAIIESLQIKGYIYRSGDLWKTTEYGERIVDRILEYAGNCA